MKQKPKIIFICYFCGKRMTDAETEMALDEKGNCIMSQSKKLTDDDTHFICKECWEKAKKFFDW